jgi:hypothetical protein
MPRKALLIVAVCLTLYAVAVVASMAIVLLYGTAGGSTLPALVLTAPVGCIAVPMAGTGDRADWAVLAALGAMLNASVFVLIVRRISKRCP